ALEQLAPFEPEHDREDVGAIEGVRPFRLERQLAGRHRLLDHSHVEKEGLGTLPRENLYAVVHAAAVVVDTKRDGTTVRRQTAAVLDRSCRAGRGPWRVEPAVG